MSENFNHDVFISFSFKDQSVAENIVNLLSSTYGISCWICTRDIDGGRRYKKLIPSAIDHAKAVVFLQSASAIESKEIPKEIGLAFEADKPIIPFKLDDAKLKGDLRYDLYGIEYIDATVPTFEERIGELASAIKKIIIGEQQAVKEKLLSTPAVVPRTIFFGREGVLFEIDEKFKKEGRVLVLRGIGGIGKTQIAKQYAKQHKKDYDTIIYATYNGSIKNLILSETPFAIEPEMIRYTLSDGTMEKDDDFYKRKLEKIKKLSNEKTLIILDNFDVESDENLTDLVEINCRLLITTRCDYSCEYPTIRINPIDSMESLKDIFMKNYDGYEVERDDPFLEKLIEQVNRHTYTVELLAQHMENSGQTAEEMIEALEKEGILSLNEEVRNADMKTQVAYENLLKMFKLFSLNDEEKQILMYLSLMPIEGVNVRDFKKWAGLKSLKMINSLKGRSWIIHNTEGIALHPIIKSIIQHELPATEENCLDFIGRFAESIEEQKAWYFKKAEKDKYGVISKKLLSIFKIIKPETEALYYNSEVMFGFAIDPEYAEKLAYRLYDYYLKNYGKHSYEVGRSAYKLGCLYIYNPTLVNTNMSPLQWLELAESILSPLEMHTDEQKGIYSQLQGNLSKMHLQLYLAERDEREFDSTLAFAMKGLDLTKKYFCSPDHPYHNRISGAYITVAYVLGKHKEYDRALAFADKAIEFLHTLPNNNESDEISALQRKAEILYYSEQYDGLKEMIYEIIQGRIEHQGVVYFRTMDSYLLLGDCCTALGERDEAVQAYTKALEIAEKLYAPGAKQIAELREKIEKLK